MILAGDWHVEETVDPESVAGRNEFNLTIAERRIERFFQSAIWYVEHHRASGQLVIRDMVLSLLGDFMSGRIHPDNIETGALSPTETVLWLLPKMRNGIATLVDALKLEHLAIPCSHGNHGRTTEKNRISTGAVNSYEWLFYNVLAGEFAADKRISFEITRSEHQYVKVYDFWLHQHHGTEVRYNGGVGGIGIPILKAVDAWDRVKPCYLHLMGHLHQKADFERAVVNGPLIGYNAFGLAIRAPYQPPSQVALLLDKRRGKTMVAPLWVAEHEERCVS